MTEFYGKNGQNQVLRAFQKSGLAGAYDSSEDNLIAIDGVNMADLNLQL